MTDAAAHVREGQAMKTICPICGHETFFEGNPFRPFCTERCKLMDLGNWISENYRLPSTVEGGAEEIPPPSSNESEAS